MSKMRLYLQNHPTLKKTIFFLGVILVGCFLFPLRMAPLRDFRFRFTFLELYIFIISYLFIAAGFTTIYGKNKEGLVYITSLILTGLGMIGRYILEYGEVSNTRNFTIINVVLYLLIIPICTSIAYHIFIKYGVKKE